MAERTASPTRWLAGLAVLAGAAVAPGCAHDAPASRETPNALAPRGTGSRIVAEEWWFTFSLGSVVFVTVMGLTLFVLGTRRRRTGPVEPDDRGKLQWIWIGGIIVPVVLIGAVFGVSMRSIVALDGVGGDDELTVSVTGHQYWWEVEYEDLGISSANEVHVPVGEPVRIELTSADVIHSFWVPEIHPKLDMIPGETNVLTIQAERAGTYRGVCAEYCGLQHARMQFVLVAMPPDRFDEWAAARIQGPPEPAGDVERAGFEVFGDAGCAACHAVAGTDYQGWAGPDLSDVGSRLTLGAGVLDNNPGNLGGWISDPQQIKPGVRMPATRLEGEDLIALIAYLRSLR